MATLKSLSVENDATFGGTVGAPRVALSGAAAQAGDAMRKNEVEQAVAAGRWVAAPLAWNSTGLAGQEAYDANYYYICVATNTWRRTAIATF